MAQRVQVPVTVGQSERESWDDYAPGARVSESCQQVGTMLVISACVPAITHPIIPSQCISQLPCRMAQYPTCTLHATMPLPPLPPRHCGCQCI